MPYLIIELHQAKEIVRQLNDLAISTDRIENKSLREEQILHIDIIKKILQDDTKLKEE